MKAYLIQLIGFYAAAFTTIIVIGLYNYGFNLNALPTSKTSLIIILIGLIIFSFQFTKKQQRNSNQQI